MEGAGNSPDVSNGGGHKGLKGGHAETSKQPRDKERNEGLGCSSPKASDHQSEGCKQIDWSFSVLDGQAVPKQTPESDAAD